MVNFCNDRKELDFHKVFSRTALSNVLKKELENTKLFVVVKWKMKFSIGKSNST